MMLESLKLDSCSEFSNSNGSFPISRFDFNFWRFKEVLFLLFLVA